MDLQLNAINPGTIATARLQRRVAHYVDGGQTRTL